MTLFSSTNVLLTFDTVHSILSRYSQHIPKLGWIPKLTASARQRETASAPSAYTTRSWKTRPRRTSQGRSSGRQMTTTTTTTTRPLMDITLILRMNLTGMKTLIQMMTLRTMSPTRNLPPRRSVKTNMDRRHGEKARGGALF